MQVHQLHDKELLFEEGNITNKNFYGVLRGEISIQKRSKVKSWFINKDEVEILKINTGFCFGESAIINGCARNASAYSVGITELFYMDQIAFEISFFVRILIIWYTTYNILYITSIEMFRMG